MIPGAKIVDSADLAIHYQATDPRAAVNLELSVSLNDVEVTTLPVTKSSGSFELAHVSLPADLLVHDNNLSFQLRRELPDSMQAVG